MPCKTASEYYARQYLSRFESDQEAFYRLDSIAFFAMRNNLPPRKIREDLEWISQMCADYENKVEALKVLEKAYGKAAAMKGTPLYRYMQTRGGKIKMQRAGIKAVPLVDLSVSMRGFSRGEHTVKNLEWLAERVLIGKNSGA